MRTRKEKNRKQRIYRRYGQIYAFDIGYKPDINKIKKIQYQVSLSNLFSNVANAINDKIDGKPISLDYPNELLEVIEEFKPYESFTVLPLFLRDPLKIALSISLDVEVDSSSEIALQLALFSSQLKNIRNLPPSQLSDLAHFCRDFSNQCKFYYSIPENI